MLPSHTSNWMTYTLPAEQLLASAEKILYQTTPQEDMYLYLLRPEGDRWEPLPAIIYFTGGGWANGEPTGMISNAAWFRDQGIIGISADYRVGARHGTTPMECVQDAGAALRYVRAHAEELGVYPDRIIAAGGSAGGHLAACTVSSGEAQPDALALHNPVLGAGFGEEFFAVHPELSPIRQVRAGWPPTILSNGTQDDTTPHIGAEEFTRLMRGAGNACELISIPDAGHSCDWPADNPHYLPPLTRMAQFLRHHGLMSTVNGTVSH